MTPIEKYFNAEKAESLLFILVGVIAIGLSVYFLMKIKQPFYDGVAYPLIAVALIQLVVGSSVFVRSPKDIQRVNQILQSDKSSIQTEEIPRMQVVMKNFVLYRWVEIALLLMGIAIFSYFEPLTLWKGVGLGLAIQSGLMLLLDFFAENRGRVYMDFLKSLL